MIFSGEKKSYSEEYQRRKDTGRALQTPPCLLTDRTAYVNFLEVQLERVSNACLTVQGYDQKFADLTNLIVNLEQRCNGTTKLVSLAQQCSEEIRTENQVYTSKMSSENKEEREQYMASIHKMNTKIISLEDTVKSLPTLHSKLSLLESKYHSLEQEKAKSDLLHQSEIQVNKSKVDFLVSENSELKKQIEHLNTLISRNAFDSEEADKKLKGSITLVETRNKEQLKSLSDSLEAKLHSVDCKHNNHFDTISYSISQREIELNNIHSKQYYNINNDMAAMTDRFTTQLTAMQHTVDNLKSTRRAFSGGNFDHSADHTDHSNSNTFNSLLLNKIERCVDDQSAQQSQIFALEELLITQLRGMAAADGREHKTSDNRNSNSSSVASETFRSVLRNSAAARQSTRRDDTKNKDSNIEANYFNNSESEGEVSESMRRRLTKPVRSESPSVRSERNATSSRGSGSNTAGSGDKLEVTDLRQSTDSRRAQSHHLELHHSQSFAQLPSLPSSRETTPRRVSRSSARVSTSRPVVSGELNRNKPIGRSRSYSPVARGAELHAMSTNKASMRKSVDCNRISRYNSSNTNSPATAVKKSGNKRAVNRNNISSNSSSSGRTEQQLMETLVDLLGTVKEQQQRQLSTDSTVDNGSEDHTLSHIDRSHLERAAANESSFQNISRALANSSTALSASINNSRHVSERDAVGHSDEEGETESKVQRHSSSVSASSRGRQNQSAVSTTANKTGHYSEKSVADTPNSSNIYNNTNNSSSYYPSPTTLSNTLNNSRSQHFAEQQPLNSFSQQNTSHTQGDNSTGINNNESSFYPLPSQFDSAMQGQHSQSRDIKRDSSTKGNTNDSSFVSWNNESLHSLASRSVLPNNLNSSREDSSNSSYMLNDSSFGDSNSPQRHLASSKSRAGASNHKKHNMSFESHKSSTNRHTINAYLEELTHRVRQSLNSHNTSNNHHNNHQFNNHHSRSNNSSAERRTSQQHCHSPALSVAEEKSTESPAWRPTRSYQSKPLVYNSGNSTNRTIRVSSHPCSRNESVDPLSGGHAHTDVHQTIHGSHDDNRAVIALQNKVTVLNSSINSSNIVSAIHKHNAKDKNTNQSGGLGTNSQVSYAGNNIVTRLQNSDHKQRLTQQPVRANHSAVFSTTNFNGGDTSSNCNPNQSDNSSTTASTSSYIRNNCTNSRNNIAVRSFESDHKAFRDISPTTRQKLSKMVAKSTSTTSNSGGETASNVSSETAKHG